MRSNSKILDINTQLSLNTPRHSLMAGNFMLYIFVFTIIVSTNGKCQLAFDEQHMMNDRDQENNALEKCIITVINKYLVTPLDEW